LKKFNLLREAITPTDLRIWENILNFIV